MKLTVDTTQLSQFNTQMQRWPQKTRDAMAWAVQRAAQAAAVEMKLAAPKAFSLLTNSIKVDEKSPAAAWVGPHVIYAWWVEKGRKPGGGMPPRSALLDWVKVKRLASDDRGARSLSWVIARSIQRRGIQPKPFVAPTAEKIRPQLQQWALDRLAQTFGTA